MLEKICAVRESRGISQALLEERCGLSQGRISKWKNGQGEPTARQIWRISQVLDVPVQYLLDDELTEPPAPELTPDDWRILDWIHDVEMDRKTALRRLAAPEGWEKYGSMPDAEEIERRKEQIRRDRDRGKKNGGRGA